jgi:hypothetical protein
MARRAKPNNRDDDTMTKPEVRSDDPSGTSELDLIQQESEAQALPEQEKLFRVAPRIRSKLHNLPDPTRPRPFGSWSSATHRAIRLPPLRGKGQQLSLMIPGDERGGQPLNKDRRAYRMRH